MKQMLITSCTGDTMDAFHFVLVHTCRYFVLKQGKIFWFKSDVITPVKSSCALHAGSLLRIDRDTFKVVAPSKLCYTECRTPFPEGSLRYACLQMQYLLGPNFRLLLACSQRDARFQAKPNAILAGQQVLVYQRCGGCYQQAIRI